MKTAEMKTMAASHCGWQQCFHREPQRARTGYFKRLHALSDALIAFRPALADEEEEEDGGLISASFVYLCSPAFGEMYVTEETEAAQKQPENMNLNDF